MLKFTAILLLIWVVTSEASVNLRFSTTSDIVAVMRGPVSSHVCSAQCDYIPDCGGFKYHSDDRLCQLFTSLDSGVETSIGWMYGYKKSGLDVSQQNPCKESKCENGGHCLPVGEEAVCNCPPGYSGVHCDLQQEVEAVRWRAWGACSVACGRGYQTRQSVCVVGDVSCQVETEIRLCGLENCTFSVEKDTWSEWTECDSGSQRRDKLRCIEGGSCAVRYTEERVCSNGVINRATLMLESADFGEGLLSLVAEDGSRHHFEYSDGVAWTLAGEVVCRELGFPKLHSHSGMKVPSDSASIRRVRCGGDESSVTKCSVEVLSGVASKVVYLQCAVDGGWSLWNAWSRCDCTTQLEMRSRQCNQPPTARGGADCYGAATETKECRSFEFCSKTTIAAATWSTWSDWDLCSSTCGHGLTARRRDCAGPECVTALEEEREECSLFNCHILKSCSAWSAAGQTKDASYPIRPDGHDSFLVFCNMTASPVVTLITHDHAADILVDGYEARQEFYSQLKYDSGGLRNAIRLVDSSVNCSQAVSWKCYAAAIHNMEWDVEQALTFWFARDATPRYYWGGAPKDPTANYCPCSETDTCVQADLKCDCDANDDVWREDGGHVTRREDLPISALAAGDTEAANEKGYFAVGPLMCWD